MIVIKEDRTVERVRGQAEEWKRQIREASDKRERDHIIFMWIGYLNGLRMAGVLTYGEYLVLYGDLKEYADETETECRKGGVFRL